jgi:glyoxylase I family protein
MTDFVPIRSLHHFAWRCRDAEETRVFYEDVLGLPLVHLIRSDTVPSTGEYCPYVHIFFELRDGSCLAFFDLGDDASAEPSPNTPAWVNHLALEVGSVEDLERARERLEAHGVDVLGPTDHHFVKSIYLRDPNGIRLELTARTASEAYLLDKRAGAHAELSAWNQQKEERRSAATAKVAAG